MNISKMKKLMNIMNNKDIDAIIIKSPSNLEYLLEINFETPTVIVVVYRDLTYRIYVSKLDRDRLLDSLEIDKDNIYILTVEKTEEREINYREVYKHALKECKSIGIDDTRSIEKISKECNVKILDVSEDILRVRSVKDDCEIENIERAVRIAEKCIETVSNMVKPGIREIDIEAQLCKLAIEHESWFAFKPIVASGPNSAYPHHVSTSRRIRSGDFVVIDFGVKFKCYCSDITRTVYVGYPTSEVRDLFNAVYEAHSSALKLLKPGTETREVDGHVREVLREYNLDKYFIHSTGHGIGIECHEYPSISRLSNEKLEIGNVITIEPGVYFRSRCGIRIEDDYVITSSGFRKLTRIPQLLI